MIATMDTSSSDVPVTGSDADVLLADGTMAVVRRLLPDDADDLAALHARTSADSLRLRFFAPSRYAAQHYVEHVLSSPATLAVVAVADGVLVGLGTAEPVDEQSSEIAFLVDDACHGLGLGTLLLEHLAAQARDRGIDHFVADVLADNQPMLRVFADAGFEAARRLEDGIFRVELSTTVTSAGQRIADTREFHDEALSLAPLLRPRSVAVVGIRRDGTGVGAEVVRSIRSGGFQGRLALVHPEVGELLGAPTYRRVADVPDGVDLVVVAVPALAARAALEDAAAGGAGAVVVVSSGFAEAGPEGAKLQEELATTARRLGIRLVGPNCLGVVGNDPAIRIDATFAIKAPPTGGLAVASQSGGVGIALLERLDAEGLGLSCFVSLGNKADVSGNDLLAAWYDDPQVSVAALYLESFGNARKFARFARRFAERKPLLAVVGGRSSGGRRAGASHTASAATAAIGVEALFTQSGVIACHDTDDVIDTARLLAEQPLPAGPRLAIVSNAGGMGVLAADLADDLDLEVPELSVALQDRLHTRFPGSAGTGNPLDVGAVASPTQIAGTVAEIVESGEVDSVLVVLVPTALSDNAGTVAALAEVRATRPDFPLLLVPIGDTLRRGAPEGSRGLTHFASMRAALEALNRVTRYAAWRAVPQSVDDPADPVAGRLARAAAQRLLRIADVRQSGDGRGTWVSGSDARQLLELYGIDLAGAVAQGEVEAVEVATRLGFPVAVKADDAEILHKTELGLVHLGLDSPDAVRAAVRQVEATLGRPVAVLVQPQVAGIELALGIARDPGLGAMVMLAAGGIATDVWDDRVFLVPPLTSVDAARAVRALRLWPLLDGFRGTSAADVAGIERLVLALGRLALEVPQVAELDLNPVLVGPVLVGPVQLRAGGCVVVDVALRLAEPADPVGEALQVRRLRPVR